LIVRALVVLSSACFAVGFALAWANDGEAPTLAFVLIGVSVAISMGFAVRKAFYVLREMLSMRSG
jgi:hypothetical protein